MKQRLRSLFYSVPYTRFSFSPPARSASIGLTADLRRLQPSVSENREEHYPCFGYGVWLWWFMRGRDVERAGSDDHD